MTGPDLGVALAPLAPAIAIEDVHVRFGNRVVVDGVSLDVSAGEVFGLLGPNGCGKSTLLRCVLGVLTPIRGRVFIEGTPVDRLPPAVLARRLAAQTQEAEAALGYTVRDVVEMGRLAHRSFFGSHRAHDAAVVADAMARLEVDTLADHAIETLSGGERQRVMIARALAQEPRILILDEPTNHLDVRHQFSVLDLLRALGATVLVTLHDLGLAARICDRIAVMSGGRIAAIGSPAETLTPATITRVYGVGATVARPDASATLDIRLFPLRQEVRP